MTPFKDYQPAGVIPATLAAFHDDLPYNAAQIELEEGPRLTANLIGVDNDKITVGMAVEVVFDDVSEEVTLPRFTPAA